MVGFLFGFTPKRGPAFSATPKHPWLHFKDDEWNVGDLGGVHLRDHALQLADVFWVFGPWRLGGSTFLLGKPKGNRQPSGSLLGTSGSLLDIRFGQFLVHGLMTPSFLFYLKQI